MTSDAFTADTCPDKTCFLDKYGVSPTGLPAGNEDLAKPALVICDLVRPADRSDRFENCSVKDYRYRRTRYWVADSINY